MAQAPNLVLQAGSHGLMLRCAGLYRAVLWDAARFGSETIEVATAFYSAGVAIRLIPASAALLVMASSERADDLYVARVSTSDAGPQVTLATVPGFGWL